MKIQMKPSKWLSESIDSHGAYDADEMRADFEKKTGEKWPQYLKGTEAKELRREVGKDPKGLLTLNAKDEQRIVGGWIIAREITESLVGYRSHCMGRGFEYRDCIEALKKGGK